MSARSTPKKKVMKKKVLAKRSIKKSVIKQIIKPKVLGKVEHYYDRIGVAIVKLIAPLSVGETVLFRHGEHSVEEHVESIQLNHIQVPTGKKGEIIGVKVHQKICDGSLVVPKK